MAETAFYTMLSMAYVKPKTEDRLKLRNDPSYRRSCCACGVDIRRCELPSGDECARCSLRRRSGARQPRHARAQQGALRVAAGGSAPPISFVALRGPGAARSGRESRLAGRTGKQDL